MTVEMRPTLLTLALVVAVGTGTIGAKNSGEGFQNFLCGPGILSFSDFVERELWGIRGPEYRTRIVVQPSGVIDIYGGSGFYCPFRLVPRTLQCFRDDFFASSH
jgi:hypothetical protein